MAERRLERRAERALHLAKAPSRALARGRRSLEPCREGARDGARACTLARRLGDGTCHLHGTGCEGYLAPRAQLAYLVITSSQDRLRRRELRVRRVERHLRVRLLPPRRRERVGQLGGEPRDGGAQHGALALAFGTGCLKVVEECLASQRRRRHLRLHLRARRLQQRPRQRIHTRLLAGRARVVVGIRVVLGVIRVHDVLVRVVVSALEGGERSPQRLNATARSSGSNPLGSSRASHKSERLTLRLLPRRPRRRLGHLGRFCLLSRRVGGRLRRRLRLHRPRPAHFRLPSELLHLTNPRFGLPCTPLCLLPQSLRLDRTRLGTHHARLGIRRARLDLSRALLERAPLVHEGA